MNQRLRAIATMQFGKLYKTDFLIPAFALFYFYLLFVDAFDLPIVSTQGFFHFEIIAWIGVFFV